MATPIALFNDTVNTLVDTPQTFYTAPASGNGVLVDAITATNNSTVNASYKIYIGIAGTTPDTPLKPFKIVVWGELDNASGAVNQVIPAGYALWIEASALESIYVTASGREI